MEKKQAVISIKVKPSLKAEFQKWCWTHHFSKSGAIETMLEALVQEGGNPQDVQK